MKIVNKLLALLFVTTLFGALNSINAQGKYIDKKGKINFEASEKLFEPQAVYGYFRCNNEKGNLVVDTQSGEKISLSSFASEQLELFQLLLCFFEFLIF